MEFWTQTYGKKTRRFYSPVKRSHLNVAALQWFLRDYSSIQIIPIVLFPKRENLIVETSDNLLDYSELIPFIMSYQKEIISSAVCAELTEKILDANVADLNTLLSPLERVTRKLKSLFNKPPTPYGRCPDCKSELYLCDGRHSAPHEYAIDQYDLRFSPYRLPDEPSIRCSDYQCSFSRTYYEQDKKREKEMEI